MGEKNYTPRGKFNKNFLSDLPKHILEYLEYNNCKENELDLKVRGDYLNIYYKGGSLLKLSGKKSIYFNEYYFLPQEETNLCSSVIRKSIQTDNKARAIHENLKAKRDKIINNLRNAATIQETAAIIKEMKKVMDEWRTSQSSTKNERSIQQYISLNNKSFDGSTDYVVLDIEYALPYEAVYFNKEKYRRNQHPRLDIVAIDKTGQVYVMELKYGMKSVDNIKSHANDFKETVGHPEKWKAFIEDIEVLFKYQKENGFINRDMTIDTNRQPRFAFIMKMGKTEDKHNFEKRLKQNDLSDVMTLYLPVDNENGYPSENYKLKKPQ